MICICSASHALFGRRRQARVLHRRDLVTTTQLLKSARAEFRSAGDASGTSEVDEALIKIKADIVVQAIATAREVSTQPGGEGGGGGRGGNDYSCFVSGRAFFKPSLCFWVSPLFPIVPIIAVNNQPPDRRFFAIESGLRPRAAVDVGGASLFCRPGASRPRQTTRHAVHQVLLVLYAM